MDRLHLNYLFLAIDGRIPRQAYWIGFAVIIVGYIVLATILSFVMNISLEEMVAQGPKTVWLNIILTLVFLYPSIAVFAKRLHDRNRSALWLILAYGLGLVGLVFELAGLAGTPEEPASAMIILGLVSLIVNIWLFIECGFIRGTPGENQYGPDPLGGVPDASYD